MSEILLTIAIPAYNRPHWLRRLLFSIASCPVEIQSQVEVIVSDDSTIAECGTVFNECIRSWHGSSHYERNQPSLGMAGNWNHCIRLAQGQYLLILHDDDYLEPEGVEHIVTTLKRYSQYAVFLFGVHVVDPQGRILKRQRFKEDQYLRPMEALKQVLTNSSFVRFPGIVIQKNLLDSVGYFDEMVGGTADLYLWVKLLHSAGLMGISIVTANYTVHSEALTMGMFNQSVVESIIRLFEWVEVQGWLPDQVLRDCRVNYLHQFILAGTFRYLRRFKFKQAQQVFRLFKNCSLYQSSTILKWKILRICFQVILN